MGVISASTNFCIFPPEESLIHKGMTQQVQQSVMKRINISLSCTRRYLKIIRGSYLLEAGI